MRPIARRGLAAALIAPLLFACHPPAPPKRPEARVIVDSSQGPFAVRVEVARSDAELERGLMFRSHLDEDAGMIFVFQKSGRHAFWMKNTLLPLDMLFIGEDSRVDAIVERAPLGEDSNDGGVPSRYVLEVNRGFSRSHGIRPGDRVHLENVLY